MQLVGRVVTHFALRLVLPLVEAVLLVLRLVQVEQVEPQLVLGYIAAVAAARLVVSRAGQHQVLLRLLMGAGQEQPGQEAI
jgi:hypothetical protein